MKILLLTQLFQPEPNHLKGLAFAKKLGERGHEIEVLTGFPNYPYGKLYPGYTMRALQRETLEGVPVTRTAMFPSHDASSFRRMLTYVSFAFTAAAAALFVYRRSRFDIVHVYQGPATLMIPGIILACLTRAKLVLDVQDLWPESVSSSGMMKNRILLWMIGVYVRLCYRMADRIIVLSNGYKEKIVLSGVEAEKITVIYNWCDESFTDSDGEMPDDLCRLKHQGKSIVLYAGTMGPVQALESVIDAAAVLEPSMKDIHFAFVGSGTEAEHLKDYAASKKLSNVSFYPRAEARHMGPILAGADALLIHLKKEGVGVVGIPQKTQAYLAAGRPVVMAADGEAGRIMKDSHAALCCEPENPVEIADAVRHLFMKTREERMAMGESGARFYRESMSFEIGVGNVIDAYTSLFH
ncbi:MAG: glycosyltransferase family 4 protein [Acidobacteriota bacterium]